MINLDYSCVVIGQKIASSSSDKNFFQKALGVLKEDGVFALFLWLYTQSKTNTDIIPSLIELLNEEKIRKYLLSEDDLFPVEISNKKELFMKIGKVAKDINKLFFMKKILERTLIYAFYHAKIAGDN